jgi:RNA polymerase sigma-70 factor (ECF subfamily)
MRSDRMQRDLVEAARRGDHDAFEALVIAAGDRLYSMARLVLRDADRAEEAVQDALLRAWRQLPSLRDPERFDAWVYRLLVHACADVGRRNQRWSAEVRMIQAEPATEDGTASLATRDQLERGFRRLRPEQRAVVVLHHYLGLAVPEVAEVLGIPVGTAKSRIHYAMEVLRAALEADDRDTFVATNGRTA